MKYQLLADAYAKIEATSSRLKITSLLADLFRRTPKSTIARLTYLTQGKLYPDFEGIEIGVAEKMAVRGVAQATGQSPEAVARQLARSGDLGSVVEVLRAKDKTRRSLLTVDKVYDGLDTAARASGEGAQAARTAAIAGLLARATPAEAKYIARTATGKLRLGVGDMTILDALAEVFAGGRQARKELERAYNLTSDLGYVATVVAEGGLKRIREIHVVVGKPIRPMLAERLGDPAEILAKLGGRCIAEYKYDGERLQIHKKGKSVEIFSRRLEKITAQYPDVADLARRNVKADAAIVEGEVVAVDAETGDLRPFQDLMPRRRKYGIEEAVTQIPTTLFAFDTVYVDGQDLTAEPYQKRREALAHVLYANNRFQAATSAEVTSVDALDRVFEQAVQDGCEGLMCKALGGVYQAGARGWLWIKFKREYRSEMTDAVDLVVVGAFHGRGRRGGTYGALLLAAYDDKSDTFQTVCKVGSGFSDEFLDSLPKMLRRYERAERPARVDSRMVPDVWLEPMVVFEVIGAEITLSPVHTAGRDLIRKGTGLAIRFPRFKRVRDDKSPTDATTVKEVAEMYRRRLKKTS